jgi:hypothetical protein
LSRDFLLPAVPLSKQCDQNIAANAKAAKPDKLRRFLFDPLPDSAAIAEPELVYPESSAPKSTRPSGSGDLVFTQQETGTLVLL